MENYSRTLELVKTAEESAGRSEEQFAKYQDTLEYKLKQLKNTWEQFRMTFSNGDTFKSALETVNQLLEKLQRLNLRQIVASLMMVTTLGLSGAKNSLNGLQMLTTSLTDAVAKGVNGGYALAAKGARKLFVDPVTNELKAGITSSLKTGLSNGVRFSGDLYKDIKFKDRENAARTIDSYLNKKNGLQSGMSKAVESVNKLESDNSTLGIKEKILQSEYNRTNSQKNNNIDLMRASGGIVKDVQKNMDKINGYYSNLSKDINKYYDEQINKIEKNRMKNGNQYTDKLLDKNEKERNNVLSGYAEERKGQVVEQRAKRKLAESKIKSAYQENKQLMRQLKETGMESESVKQKIASNEQLIKEQTTLKESYSKQIKQLDEKFLAENPKLAANVQRVQQAQGTVTTSTPNVFGRAINSYQARKEAFLNDKVGETADGRTVTKGEQMKGQAATAVSQGISFAISTAITSAILGADTKTVLMNALIAGLSAAGPALVSLLIELVVGVVASPVLIGAIALVVAGAIITAGFNAEKEKERIETERLKNIAKTQKELQKEQLENIEKIKKAEQEKLDLEEKISRINELQAKSFLNSDETEELSNLTTAINDSYPDIVDSFNENTNEIKINSEKLKELNETLIENKDKQIQEEYARYNAEKENIEDRRLKTQEILNGMTDEKGKISPSKLGEGFKKLREIYGEDFDTYFTEDWMKNIDENNAKDIIKNEEIGKEKIKNLSESINNYFDELIKEIELEKEMTYIQVKSDTGEIAAKAIAKTKNSGLTEEEIEKFDTAKNQTNPGTYKDESEYIQTENTRLREEKFEEFDITKNEINPETYKEENENSYSTDGFYNAIKKGKISKAAKIADIDEDILREALYNLGYSDAANEEKGIKSFSDFNIGLFDYIKYEKLSDGIKQRFSDIGITSSNYSADIFKKEFGGIFYNEILSVAEFKKREKQSGNLNTYENLSEIIEDYQNKTSEEYENAIRKFAENNNMDADALINNLLEDENSYSYKFKDMEEQLNSIGIETANITYESLEAILSNFKDGNYSNVVATKWGELFSEVTKGLNSDSAAILGGIDLKQSYGTLLAKSSEYVDALVEAGMNSADAARVYAEYIDKASKILGKAIFTSEGVDIFKETLTEAYEANESKNEKLIEAITMMNKDGSLNYTMVKKLIKEGLNDTYTVKDGKYVLTEDAYNKYGKEQTYVYGTYRNQVDINKNQLDYYQNLLRHGADNIAGGSMETAYNYYKEMGTFGGIYANLSDDAKEFIIKAKESDMSLSEFVISLKDAGVELEKIKPEMQIQAINELALGYDNASEKLEEYTEKLEDYYEQLEDYNEQLADQADSIKDAQEKLDEAYNGSKNLQSGLNEFQAFDEKLSDIDTKLQEINSDLEDFNEISNISANIQSKLALEADQAAIKIAKGLSAQDEIAKAQAQLASEFGATFDENGRANLNLDYLSLQENDAIRKKYEELVDYLNTNIEVAQENNKDKVLKELEKSRREEIKKHYDTIAKLDENNIKVLQENAKEEVEETKKKYDALKEADNDYLEALEDAINKQRKLREMEKDDENLAKQEKKLSLMRRDTSGANQVELAKLEEEIQDKRESSFDKKVDNVLDNLKELYKKEEELKEEELEALEAVTEDVQYFAEVWQQIRDSFTSADDYVSWRLENDQDLEDLTPEQTQAKIYELQDEYNNFVVAQTSITDGLKVNQEDLLIKSNEIYENLNNLSTDYVENLNALTAKTVEEAIESAEKALKSAQDSYDKTVEKIKDLNEKIADTEENVKALTDSSTLSVQSFVENVKDLGDLASAEVESALVKILASLTGIDANTSEGWDELMGVFKDNDLSIAKDNYYKVKEVVTGSNSVSAGDTMLFSLSEIMEMQNKITKNANGGLVDYTGLAWVDGSTTRPEAFLSAEDTARIGAAAQLLSNIDFLTNGNLNTNSISSNVGDTSIEIHINVDKLSSDYDVDNLVERIKKDIVNVSKPVGSSVILAK